MKKYNSNKMNNYIPIIYACSNPDCPYCKGKGEIKVVSETTREISYYQCFGDVMSGTPIRTERISNNPNTQLPVEIVEEINNRADELYPLIRDVRNKIGYKVGATEYATKLHRLQVENERLSNAFKMSQKTHGKKINDLLIAKDLLNEVLCKPATAALLEKIKKFLYGE